MLTTGQLTYTGLNCDCALTVHRLCFAALIHTHTGMNCACILSHHGLRERPFGRGGGFFGHLLDYGKRFFFVLSILDWVFRNFKTWNNCDIQRLKGRLHNGDYKVDASWITSLQFARINSVVSLKQSKQHMCRIRDVMFVLIQHPCAYVEEMTT